jgi:hypothetical protein
MISPAASRPRRCPCPPLDHQLRFSCTFFAGKFRYFLYTLQKLWLVDEIK